jgi:hypothetical protein
MAAWIGVRLVNGANLWSPGPLLTVLPAWLIGQTLLGNIDAGPRLIPLMGALLFMVLAIPLYTPRSQVVWPPVLFTGVLACASILFFVVSWSSGLEYQGLVYTATLVAINLGLAVASARLAWRAFSRSNLLETVCRYVDPVPLVRLVCISMAGGNAVSVSPSDNSLERTRER